MHDIINFLKPAVNRAPNTGVAGCYIATGTSIFAYNGSIQAGVSAETGASFNVPAAELEAALGRMQMVSGLEFNGETLTVRGGRLRVAIQCIVDVAPAFPVMPGKWLACPPALGHALQLAAPFTSEQGWSSGIRLSSNCVTAIKNTGGIKIDVPGLELEKPVLITATCAQFIEAVGMPAMYAVVPGAVFFQWMDGRWLRAQLLNTEMPNDVVESIFAAAGSDTPCPITADWRQSFEDVAVLSEGRITLDAQGWHGSKGAGRVDIEIGTPGLGADSKSAWQAAALAPVMACAAAWNPGSYPKGSLFIGPGIRGVVIGTR